MSPDGHRIARVTLEGQVSEFEIEAPGPSPINIAVGPDRNVWFTQGGTLNRVEPDGRMTSFAVPGRARTIGLSAGSDRGPAERLGNRLWFADGLGNRIGYLSFEP
jgi:virginiamycin B lyase